MILCPPIDLLQLPSCFQPSLTIHYNAPPFEIRPASPATTALNLPCSLANLRTSSSKLPGCSHADGILSSFASWSTLRVAEGSDDCDGRLFGVGKRRDAGDSGMVLFQSRNSCRPRINGSDWQVMIEIEIPRTDYLKHCQPNAALMSRLLTRIRPRWPKLAGCELAPTAAEAEDAKKLRTLASVDVISRSRLNTWLAG
jgi:hypothetical protein